MQYGTPIVALLLIVFMAGSFSSCKKKAELPVISEWEVHQDPVSGLEVKYPKGWLKIADPKRTRFYSTQIVADKFYEIYSQGSTTINEDQGGVELDISAETFKDVSVGTLEEYKATTMQNYSALNLSGEQPASFGKQSGFKYSYRVKVGKETFMQGEKIIVAHDSAFYTVSIAGFNEYFEVYKPLLEEIVASIKLPKPKVSLKDPNEAAKPSPEVERFSNDFVEFEHPDNFTVSYPKDKKGGALFALHLEGLRQDCTIDLDIFPTNKHSLDKLFDDNKGKFNPKSTGSAKIDGHDAKTLTAVPAANIDRVVYFSVKGDRLYRIILTWSKPLTNDFKPAFDKVIASMKLK